MIKNFNTLQENRILSFAFYPYDSSLNTYPRCHHDGDAHFCKRLWAHNVKVEAVLSDYGKRPNYTRTKWLKKKKKQKKDELCKNHQVIKTSSKMANRTSGQVVNN